MAEANPKRVRVAICDTNPDFVYYSEDDDEFEDNFSELDGSTPSVSSHDSDGESNVTSEFGSNTSLQMDQAETGDQPDYISKDGTIWKEYSTSYIQSHQESLSIQHCPRLSTSSASCESPKGIYLLKYTSTLR